MKAQRGKRGIALLCLTSALDGSGWLVLCPGCFTTPPPRKRPGTHCVVGWVGPSISLDDCGKSRPTAGFNPQTIQPVEHY